MRISDWISNVCSSDLSQVSRPSMNQGPEQLLQISNRHHVGPIRWRVVGVFMRLDEHRRTTDCNGGAGKHRHEAAFATTAGALAAGQLDRSEARRVGKECVSTGNSRWVRYH